MVQFNLRRRLTLADVAEHLGGCDPRVARAALEQRGYRPDREGVLRQRYSITWLDVFRLIHRIDPAKHEAILAELAEKLLTTSDVASFIDMTPDAIRKARSRGRLVLPSSIHISTRIELWRPRDIRAWSLGHRPTDYKKPPSVKQASAAASTAPGIGNGGVFSAFFGTPEATHRPDAAHSSRTASASSGKYT